MKTISLSTFTMPAYALSTPFPISAEPNEVIYSDENKPRVLMACCPDSVIVGAFDNKQAMLACLSQDAFKRDTNHLPREYQTNARHWFHEYLTKKVTADEDDYKALYIETMLTSHLFMGGTLYVVASKERRDDRWLSAQDVMATIRVHGAFGVFSEGDSMVMAPRWPVRRARIL